MSNLLPIHTRVTHFDGAPGTHGKGTIIGYNGVQPSRYFEERPKEAIELAGAVGMLDALVNSVYSGDRHPYVVRWDYRQEFFDRHPHLKEKHPHGYTDVYDPDCIKAIPEQIFKVGDKLKLVRHLDDDQRTMRRRHGVGYDCDDERSHQRNSLTHHRRASKRS